MEDYDEGPGTPVKMGHYTVNDTFNFKEDKGVRIMEHIKITIVVNPPSCLIVLNHFPPLPAASRFALTDDNPLPAFLTSRIEPRWDGP